MCVALILEASVVSVMGSGTVYDGTGTVFEAHGAISIAYKSSVALLNSFRCMLLILVVPAVMVGSVYVPGTPPLLAISLVRDSLSSSTCTFLTFVGSGWDPSTRGSSVHVVVILFLLCNY